MEEEETALESYETPLDKDDSPIDEYQVFKSVLESKKEYSCISAFLAVYVLAPPPPSIRQCLCYDDCLEDKREDYQKCSVLYCVTQLYTIIRTQI